MLYLSLTPLGVVSDFVSLHGSIVVGRDYTSVIYRYSFGNGERLSVLTSGVVARRDYPGCYLYPYPIGAVSDLVSSQVV